MKEYLISNLNCQCNLRVILCDSFVVNHLVCNAGIWSSCLFEEITNITAFTEVMVRSSLFWRASMCSYTSLERRKMNTVTLQKNLFFSYYYYYHNWNEAKLHISLPPGSTGLASYFLVAFFFMIIDFPSYHWQVDWHGLKGYKCEQLQDVNFWGAVYPTYYALPYLRASHGNILVTASVAGRVPIARSSFYNVREPQPQNLYNYVA